MKAWKYIKQVMPYSLAVLAAATLISSYGASNVMAGYSAMAGGTASTSVAAFDVDASPVPLVDRDLVIDDQNAAEGIGVSFTVTVNTEASAYLDLIVDFPNPPAGIGLFLAVPGEDPVQPSHVSPDRTRYEFLGMKIRNAAFKFLPSTGTQTRQYELIFKESLPGSIVEYQNHRNMKVSARIVQAD